MIKDIDLEVELQRYFNYPSFRTGQKEIIQDVLSEKDVLGVLPTGSGKSICYQLTAKLLEGITIVVSPLISLMEDQVKQLKATSFKEVIALNSFMEPKRRREIYRKLHKYKLIYVSPELLQQNETIVQLKKCDISLFVIDEAHCISQWGHEFRPDYLKLRDVVRELGNPTLLALSATATKTVQDDIINVLDRPNIVKHIHPMDRNNITLAVKEVSDNQEKQEVIVNILSNRRVPTLIYFSSRQTTEQLSMFLSEKLPYLRVAFYHGGMEQMDRITIQQQFMNNQLDVICCTSAFGMGINKNNIRLVIHYHFPSQIESYIQEIGRAGRDGGSSISLLLYSKSDEYIPWHMVQQELPSEDQLRSFFNLIENSKLKNNQPLNLEHISEQLEFTETQWRFLYYQLENHDMIDKNNVVLYEKERWTDAFHTINWLRRERITVKEGKIREMISWMNSNGCLRENLYRNFQTSYSPPIEQCCSNCGFSFHDWNPEQTTAVEQRGLNWEEKLKKLFLIGETNETK
ncbi:RecQ family ATP-dependent DNA helicase [Ornithinibacillus sp. L9]|uniref:RecQ family ATP-dependent DNA helicase n=1 Tax=Ornithinibacillus caprae TaxID=2678566 RepID=A0A6N8FC46_9BACI|nr:ATP-dependent DNA helicase RecQ [Ornithinibacillus caprae]MUK87242.1 RecQ family ATP-dependent DNA helicase [Ornithinibacillus caprae]